MQQAANTNYNPASRVSKHIRMSIFEEITMLSVQAQCNPLLLEKSTQSFS